MADSVTAFAPASIANVGPCYDLVGYALDYVGDFVTVTKVPKAKHSLVWGGTRGPCASDLANVAPHSNVAWIVAQYFLQEFGDVGKQFSIELTLHKYLPIEGGLGSSAATAAATVRALSELLDVTLDLDALVRTLTLGEEYVSGTAHGDNVVPSYFGGFHFLCPAYEENGSGPVSVRLPGCERLISIVVQDRRVRIATSHARECVREWVRHELMSVTTEPSEVLNFALMTAAKTADMVRSVLASDLKRVGWIMSNNPHLEAVRGPWIPHFVDVKHAALIAGALGCTVAGSGPSIVAVTDDVNGAVGIRDSMVNAMDGDGLWLISPVGTGTRLVDDIEAFTAESRERNNFMIPDVDALRASTTSGAYERDLVFISYSHRDKRFCDELLLHLNPLERIGRVKSWSDRQISPGSNWTVEIDEALSKAKVAVMLVTKDFLASDFVQERELGPLLKAAEAGGVRILWLLVRACSYRDTALSKYQAIIPPDKPLAEMKAERDSAWVKVVDGIKAALERV